MIYVDFENSHLSKSKLFYSVENVKCKEINLINQSLNLNLSSSSSSSSSSAESAESMGDSSSGFPIIEENDGVSVGVSARLSIRRMKSQTSSHASTSESPEARFTSEGKEPSPMVWREERRPENKEFSPVDRLEEKLTSLGNSIEAISGRSFLREEKTVMEAALRKAYKATENTFGPQSAIDWGGGFKFDELLIERDSKELAELNYDLAELARRRQGAGGRRERRLNEDSARRLGGDENIHLARLLDLARFGICVHRRPGFQENSDPPPLRQKYVLVAAAVNKKLAEQLQLGNGILVRNVVARHILGLHYSSIHWTEQTGKVAGRVLMDPSNAEEGKDSLNSDEATEAAKEMYGEIRHPTIDSIIRMILKMAELHGWDNIVL